MSYVPTLPAAAGLCVGIVSYSPELIWIPIMAAVTGVVLFCLSKYHHAALFLVAIGIGALSCDHTRLTSTDVPETKAWHDGTIISSQLSANSVKCVIELRQPPGIKVMLTIDTQNFEPYQPGTSVTFQTRLESVSASDDVPWQMNKHRYLRHEGIGYHAFVSADKIKVTDAPSGIRKNLNTFHTAAADAIVTSGVDGPVAAFLLAVILGEDVYVSPDTLNAFRMSGVAHLMAISGLHVGIMATLVMFLLMPLSFIRKGFIARSLIAVVLTWGYAAVVGFSPSVLRASVMFTTYMAARLLERDYIGFNSLFAAAIIVLLINPSWLFTPGFQLSFMSVAAIFGFLACLPQKLQRRPRLYYLICLIGVPVSAMLGAGVVAAWQFGYFPGSFLASNIIAGIIFPWIVGTGVFLAGLSACGIVVMPLAHAENLLYKAMEQSVLILSGHTGAIVENVYFSPWALVPYLVGIATAFFAVYYRKMWIAAIALSLVVSAIAIAFCHQEGYPAVEVYALRNNGDTNLVIQQNGRCLYFSSGDSTAARQTEESCRMFALHRGSHGPDRLPSSTSRITLADSTEIIILGATPLPEGYSDADYLLVDRGFAGTASDITALRPDTVLLSSGLNRKRVLKLMRELPDSIPMVDLRVKHWSHVKK